MTDVSVTRPTTIKIDQETRERMRRLGQARHRSPHWMMVEAIQQYVDREEKRQALRQDAIKAWDDFRLTGLHVGAADADSWLAKLEAGQDIEPPAACRT